MEAIGPSARGVPVDDVAGAQREETAHVADKRQDQ